MKKPASVEHGIAVDLAAVTRDLQQEEAYRREGHTARTLVRAPDLRVVLLALHAGSTISEHRVSVTASVQAISGEVQLQLPDRTVALQAGQLLILTPELAHDVHARTDSTILLTLGWRGGA